MTVRERRPTSNDLVISPHALTEQDFCGDIPKRVRPYRDFCDRLQAIPNQSNSIGPSLRVAACVNRFDPILWVSGSRVERSSASQKPRCENLSYFLIQISLGSPATWALQLAPEYLISVECIKKDALPPFTFPDVMTIKYEFGPRPGGMPPVTVYWYQYTGGDAWLPPGMSAAEAHKIPGEGPQIGPQRGQGGYIPGSGGVARPKPSPDAQQPVKDSGYNLIMAGSKGYLGTSGRGEDVGLLPGKRWAEYKLPGEYLQRSPGASTGSNHTAHLHDWVRACKGGAAACSNFSIAGKFTEWLVLGTAAVHVDGRLLWDQAKGEFSNSPEANKWVKPVFRKGWEIGL